MPKAERKPVHSALGLEIIEGLKEVLEVLRSGVPLESRFIVHDVELDFRPGDYTPEDIRRVREDVLKVSQAEFARFLGISLKTLRSWEQGQRPASPIARRFMDEIAAAPKHWRNRVKLVNKSNVKLVTARP